MKTKREINKIFLLEYFRDFQVNVLKIFVEVKDKHLIYYANFQFENR
jgi:hypothetical protein